MPFLTRLLNTGSSGRSGHSFLLAPAVISLGLFFLTLMVFIQAIGFEFINFDDDVYVYLNPWIQEGISTDVVKWAFSTTYVANWHPLTWLSHALDIQFFGLDPGSHHIVNVLLHCANTILIFIFLFGTTGSRWRSAMVAALFAVHPLHVESVAWVSERKDLLSTFFGLLAVNFYVRYARNPGVTRYVAAASLYALSLMAKPMLVTFPFLLLLLDFWPLGRLSKNPDNLTSQSIALRLCVEKIPLVMLAAASSFVTVIAQEHSGAIISGDQTALFLRFTNIVSSYATYLFKTVWPDNLSIFYPFPFNGVPQWKWIGSLLLLLPLSVLSLTFWKRFPYLAVGWLWYLGTLVPVIGFVQVGMQGMADRYTYLPLTGVFIAAVWLAEDLTRERPGIRRAGSAIGVLMLCAFAAASVRQAGHWESSTAIYRHALSATEGNWLAHNNLGLVLRVGGERVKAEAHFREALHASPLYPEAHFNLANVLSSTGRNGEAISHFRAAIGVRPSFKEAHNNLALSLKAMLRYSEAMAEFSEALRIDPAYEDAWLGLGEAYLDLNLPSEALRVFRKGTTHLPYSARLYTAISEAEYRLNFDSPQRGN